MKSRPCPQAEDHTYHTVESLVRLFARRGFDWIERHPAIAAAAAKLFDDGGRGGDGLGRTQSSLPSALRSMPPEFKKVPSGMWLESARRVSGQIEVKSFPPRAKFPMFRLRLEPGWRPRSDSSRIGVNELKGRAFLSKFDAGSRARKAK